MKEKTVKVPKSIIKVLFWLPTIVGVIGVIIAVCLLIWAQTRPEYAKPAPTKTEPAKLPESPPVIDGKDVNININYTRADGGSGQIFISFNDDYKVDFIQIFPSIDYSGGSASPEQYRCTKPEDYKICKRIKREKIDGFLSNIEIAQPLQ